LNILKPEWWNSKNCHFRVDFERIKKITRVLLVNEAHDTVIISLHLRSADQWCVDYSKVIPEINNPVHHQIYMSRLELESAFNLTDTPIAESKFADKFGLDAGVEGRFARKGNFLNMPLPSISRERDFNISILINNQIKRSVAHILTEG